MKRKYDHVLYEKFFQIELRKKYAYLDFGEMNNYEVHFLGALLSHIRLKMERGQILGGINAVELHDILSLGFLYKLKKETQISIANEVISDSNKIKYYSIDDSKWKKLTLFESIELVDDAKIEFSPTPLLYDLLWDDLSGDFSHFNGTLNSAFKRNRDSALYRLAWLNARKETEFKSKDLQNILFMKSDRELKYFINNNLQYASEFYKDILTVTIDIDEDFYIVKDLPCKKMDYSILFLHELNMLIDTYELTENDNTEEFIEFILYDDSNKEEDDYFLSQCINNIIQFHSMTENHYGSEFSIQTLSARLLETIKKRND